MSQLDKIMKPEKTLTKKDFFNKIFIENGLGEDDYFKHKNYTIITRMGIEKIQAHNNIDITYKLEKCEENFAVIKAFATKDSKTIETYGSALYGGKVQGENGKFIDLGSTTSRYIVEVAEKRAFSRAILKIVGLYEHGVFGEDESETFKNQK